MSENYKKSKYINDSIIWHIQYKLYIWYRKAPLILERLFGISQRYVLMRSNFLETQV
jgi:hypothetical protein